MAAFHNAYKGLNEIEIKLLIKNARAAEMEYAPWIQFTYPTIKSTFLNTSNQIRSNGNPEIYMVDMPTKQHFNIYFFGGSTLFGFAERDSETIPAHFEKISPKKYNVKTYNYGVPYYFSRQESVLFESLLRQKTRPEVAIFLME